MTDPPSPTMIAKKLCNMIRIAFFTVQKGVSNSRTKFMSFDPHLMIKRGKILTKAFNDLMLDHHSNFSCTYSQDLHTSFVSPISCRPNDADLAFVSPRDYEFSCSGSPTHQPYKYRPHAGRRKTHHYPRKHHARSYRAPPFLWADGAASEVTGDSARASSPNLVGQGFGWSPLVRQVRITDSPFQVRDIGDEDCLVDMEAEKFIQRFYRELRLQKWMSAHETPDYYCG